MAKMKAVRSKVTLNGELMFPNDYLSAPEFKGKDVNLSISAVSKEALQKTDGSKKGELVIRFNGTVKKFVCNKTNANTIASIHGPEASAWVGKRITLYPTRCLAFGEMVDCIRVREQAPQAKPDSKPDEPPPGAPSPDGDTFASEMSAMMSGS